MPVLGPSRPLDGRVEGKLSGPTGASAPGERIGGVEVRAKAGPGVVFLILGLALIGVGISGQRVFLGVGLVFLAIGLAAAVRQRRSGGS